MKAYYNEFDPKIAAWLRQLIKNGDILDGEVDERDILEVSPEDLKGFTQHHFFAGIGTWSYALRNAGWPDDTPVWTASLPCQPFSVAGKHLGKEDERHLLPKFCELVKQFKPNTIFGEQVEGAIKYGWLEDLQSSMEEEGFSLGHCVLGAHSIGAPHIRQRLYWVATKGVPYSCVKGLQRHREPREVGVPFRREEEIRHSGKSSHESPQSDTEWVYCKDGKYRTIKPGIEPLVARLTRGMVYSGGTIYPNNTGLARVIRLKGYGNTINAKVAELFISSFMEEITK